MRRGAFARWPVHGNVLEALLRRPARDRRRHAVRARRLDHRAGPARVRIGAGTFLNLGVTVAALELVEIGDHCMFANGCFITDANHRVDDPELPITWQGFTSKGPTRIGDNVWCGAHVVDHQRGDDRRAVRDRRQLGRHRPTSRRSRSPPARPRG